MDVQKILKRVEQLLMNVQRFSKAVQAGIVVFIVFLLFLGSFFTVDSGEFGVVLRWREVNRVADAGLHFKLPLVEDVVTMNVRMQACTTKTEAASRDHRPVQAAVRSYKPRPEPAGNLCDPRLPRCSQATRDIIRVHKSGSV